ncbi:SUKH-3 domain-containing protein [Streptomyces luteireticuli]|uniref:SUKH-3 domain-containing protein n=1 Tax=Streptomyces luteireticuli TaxID=173858 RepID=UPI0031E1CDCE
MRDSETDPRTLITEFQVYTQLLVAGWMPGRSVGGEAVALAGDIAASLTSCGYEVEPSPAAVDFIKEFAFLRVRFTDDPPGRDSVWFDVRDYDEVDAEAIAELSEWLGQPLFPVACGSEGQIALIDPRGRFFLTHWSGDYYLGKSYYEVFACLLTNRHLDLGRLPAMTGLPVPRQSESGHRRVTGPGRGGTGRACRCQATPSLSHGQSQEGSTAIARSGRPRGMNDNSGKTALVCDEPIHTR